MADASLNSQSRTLVFVGILAGHAVLICVMATRTTVMRTEVEDEVHSLPIYLMPIIETPARVRKPKAPAPPTTTPRDTIENTAIAITQPQQVPDAEATQAPEVDWGKAAATAARDASQSKAAPMKFGDSRQEELPADKKPPEIFATPRRRAGLIEELGPGIERRWISGSCYMEFGHPLASLAGPGPRVNPVQCIVGPSPGDEHMFDHLKPEYLQRK